MLDGGADPGQRAGIVAGKVGDGNAAGGLEGRVADGDEDRRAAGGDAAAALEEGFAIEFEQRLVAPAQPLRLAAGEDDRGDRVMPVAGGAAAP